MYTLISIVGTGIRNDNNGYRKTRYVFPDKTEYETHIFSEALLKTKYKDISNIIFVGTVTSGWDMLANDNESLWDKLVTAHDNNAITRELLDELEQHLTQSLKIPVTIKYHTDKIDNETSLEAFNTYNSIIPEITSENILFDITHGFRSMPILLYQALQFSVAQNSRIKNVELVYGEYISDDRCSYVRNLSSYWRYSQISDALTLFKEKLDGFKLASLIKDEWESASKAIERFSEIIQTNFCLQFTKVCRQINNSINDYPETSSEHLSRIKDILIEIRDLIDNKYESKTLYNLSLYLYKHKLNIQAVSCLQIAVETCICEYSGYKDKIGDYDWWHDHGRDKLNFIIDDNYKELSKQLYNLEHFRNQIAHGGSKNRGGDFPHAANIPKIYESGRHGLENLFRICNF